MHILHKQGTFVRFRLSAEGFQVDQSITKAISQFPKPTNRTELHSFVGLVNQLSSSINAVATILTPLRPLLCTKNDFLWNDNHDKAFAAAKVALTTAPIISFFDANRPTRLCTDASRQGLVSSYSRKVTMTHGISSKLDLDFCSRQNLAALS